MNWTDQQHAELARCFESGGVLAVATGAVELAAERGGTMTADDLTGADQVMHCNSGIVYAWRDVRAHIAAQGARVAALEAENDVLASRVDNLRERLSTAESVAEQRRVEMVREGERAEHWRQRIEKAAEALADVAPGELGRLDLVGRIEGLKAEVAAGRAVVATLRMDLAACAARKGELEAELARLKPSGQVAEDERTVRVALPPDWDIPGAALSRLVAGAQEAEALRAKVAEIEAAEARQREAKRESYREAHRLEQERDAARAEMERLKAGLNDKEVARKLLELARDRLRERAASAESRLAAIRKRVGKMTRGADKDELRWLVREDGGAPQEDSDQCPRGDHHISEHAQGGKHPPCGTERYPCSPTCTHDDAATPGHPERVRERSEAFTTSTQSLANGYVRMDDHAATAGAPGWLGSEPLGLARREGFNEGAEAMRTACLLAFINTICDKYGISEASPREDGRLAIEGAAQ